MGRSTRFFRWSRVAVATGLGLAFAATTVTPDVSRTQVAIASSAPTPMIYLDATNPASYPGTGTTVTDLSGNGRHGTISGAGVTFNSTNKSFEFPGGVNGTAYIALNADMNNFTNGITIEFEGEFGNTRSDWERIFDFAAAVGTTSNSFWVGQFEGYNELAIETFQNGPSAGYCYSATGGTALGNPGDRSFNKYVVSIGNDGNNTCRIYKNGVELPTRATTFAARNISSTGANVNGSPYALPLVNSRPSSFVGRSNFTADRDLEGSIRYLRLYQQALTPQQIAVNATRSVTFNANNGQGSMTPQTSSAAANLTTNAFTRAGFTFAGWNTDPNGNGTAYADGVSYNFVGDLTLYAQWTALATTTTVAPTTTTVAATTTVTPATTAVPTTTVAPMPEANELASATDAGDEALPAAGQNSTFMLRLAGLMVMFGVGLALGQGRRRQLHSGARTVPF